MNDRSTKAFGIATIFGLPGRRRGVAKLVSLTVLAAAPFCAGDAAALQIELTQISTPFNREVGIDYFEPTNTVITSLYYPNGAPYNFETVDVNGTRTQFSSISGLTDEVKIATSRSVARGGYSGSPFPPGTFFTGNGINGQILRINPDGTVHSTINLGAGAGLIRGSLYVDRTGVYDGDLIAVTTSGSVFRVNGAGTPTFIANVGTHLEGVITVPNDPKYGDLAGKIIAGAEQQGRMYVFDANGLTATHSNIGVNIEDIDLITGNENFFGVNYSQGRLLGADAAQWASAVGGILLTQEFPNGTSGLFTLNWDAALNGGLGGLDIEEITLSVNGITNVGQWEHVTFAPSGIVEIPPVPTPAGATLGIFGIGLAGLGAAARRRRTY